MTTTVHFEFNGYGSKTALLFREGERRPLKFHHLYQPTPKSDFRNRRPRVKCADNDRPRARLDVKNPPSPLTHLSDNTAHSRRKSFYCFVINLYGEMSEMDGNSERERERVRGRESRGVANSRRRRRRRRLRRRRSWQIKRAGNDDDLSPDGLGPFLSHDVILYTVLRR